MFNKFSTKTLIIILVILGGLAALNKFYLSKKGESTFDTNFIQIDSAAVTQILMYPKAEKGKEIKLIRSGADWTLQNDKVKTSADTAEVHRLLAGFVDVRTSSLAAEDKSGWGDFQVADTSGSRIKFVTVDNQSYEMIVGKFGFNPAARNGVTYMRHMGDEKVYAVEGYISFSVNRDFTSWRMKTVMAGNKDNWTSLTFSYPDSSFTLVKQNGKWMLNGAEVDSVRTSEYLSQLANKQSTGFVDGYVQNNSPVYTVSISGNNQPKPITIQAFPADSTQKFILHSSLNPDAWFSELKNPIADGIFVGKGRFLKQE